MWASVRARSAPTQTHVVGAGMVAKRSTSVRTGRQIPAIAPRSPLSVPETSMMINSNLRSTVSLGTKLTQRRPLTQLTQRRSLTQLTQRRSHPKP